MEEIMEDLPEDADITVDPEHSQNILPTTPTESTPTEGTPTEATPTSTSIEPSEVPATVIHEPSPPAEGVPSQKNDQSEAMVTPSEKTCRAAGDTPPENVPTHPPAGDKEETKEADRTTSNTSKTSGDRRGVAKDRLATGDNDFKYATLSRVRKFKVDDQVMQSTTKKIVDVNANRTLRDNKKYQQMR